MFPEAFIKRIEKQDYIDRESLLDSLSGPSPVSIRVNKAKWSGTPLPSKPVAWCKTGYYLDERPSFTADPLFHAGCYYVQEASSMFLEEVFSQLLTENQDLRVLDLCGAPGGKSTHLSSLIGESGTLVANEVIRSRAVILSENISKWGLSNCMVTNNDAAAFKRLPGYFDIILVDAPCSGEGMFRDPTAIREWSPANTVLCTERQRRIVMDVWPALKEGGIMIYSTCTFNPSENEANIKWLTGNTISESIRLDIKKYPGIEEIEYEGITGYGLHPGRIDGDGFFVALLRKTGEAGVRDVMHWKGTYSVSVNDIRIAEKMIDSNPEYYYRHADTFFRLVVKAQEFQLLKRYLRIVNGGITVFHDKNRIIIPDHQLALSSMIKDDAFPLRELDHEESLEYLRKGNLCADGGEKGWTIVRYRNINLGFIKNIGSRINNYYPSGWRIKMEVRPEHRSNIIKWSD